MGRHSGGTLQLHLPAVLFATSLLMVPLSLSFASAESESDESTEMLNKYLDATRTQQDVLRGFQMEVEIDAKLPRLEKQGRLRALRSISRLGRITYKALGFSGDNTVKNEVITRYLAADSETRDPLLLARTPANYKFHYKGVTEQEGRQMAIFQLTPKRKAVGLFKGELWLDVETGMPVRESGLWVKTPSLFLKKIQFVSDYELRDGVAFPKHIQSTVDTRLVGRAELSVNFSNFTRPESAEEANSSASGANQ